VNILVLGHAGSGKSTLVRNFGDFLEKKEYSVSRVNLDPATKPIFEARIDSRDFVRTEEVMDKYKLGINGALLKSMEMLEEHIPELIIDDDFVLYDTPGQLELFLYTDFGEKFSKELDNAIAVFLVDSSVCQTPENYLSAIFQSAVISLRTSIPTLTAFNKTDVLKPVPHERIEELIERGEGVLSEFLTNLLPFYQLTSLRYRRIEISAKKRQGFEDLFSAVNEIFCACGDLS
jgi:hypothetical protein